LPKRIVDWDEGLSLAHNFLPFPRDKIVSTETLIGFVGYISSPFKLYADIVYIYSIYPKSEVDMQRAA
jgi:hypothetical protein